MQKKLLIGVALVVVAGLGLFAFSQTSKAPKQESNVAQDSSSSGDSSVKGSIRSLIAQNKNVKCTYSNTSGEGTVYVSGSKVRGDMVSKDEKGNTMDASMINDGEYSYIWSSNSKDGTKIKISEAEKIANQTNTAGGAQTQSLDMDQEVDMNCAPWNVDNTLFNVPTDVRFADMTDFLKNLGGASKTKSPAASSAPAAGSSVCDQITDPQAKAACISASSGN